LRTISVSRFIFVVYLLVALVIFVMITQFALGEFKRVYYQRIEHHLDAYVHVFAQAAISFLKQGDYASLNDYCRKLTEGSHTRVTIVLLDGTVVADSESPPAGMENHANRTEIKDALTIGKGNIIRFSETLQTEMFYYAVPAYDDGVILGVARVAVPTADILRVMENIRFRVFVGGAAVALLTLLISVMVSWMLHRPLRSVIDGVNRFATGDFSTRLGLTRFTEIALLAGALNKMAQDLDDRLRAVIKERNQQEAVLSSMVEGVVAVDNQGKIMTFNEAAVRLTGINFAESSNARLSDVARNTPLYQFVNQILNSAKPKESEFGNLNQSGKILQVHGSVLRDAQGNAMGAVVVLNDVTRLRRLEQVRRDFVANVSHELRTPITSIKGFVETLLDGALQSPEDAKHFLEIVAKQSDRLNAILGDLLLLSRVEEGEEKASIELDIMPIREVLDAAIQVCSKKAAAKEISITLECDDEIRARINPSLLEQAVTNLIDNAIKYSNAGSQVMIRAACLDEVIISVEDHGCGISPEHLPRLFERFYRVDKARSRALGGTGLGLSIVNHVITAHGGRVTVESTPGAGSTFSIYLPPLSEAEQE